MNDTLLDTDLIIAPEVNTVTVYETAISKAETLESCRENLVKVKALLGDLRKANPDNVYPSDDAIDSLEKNVTESSPMVFTYKLKDKKPTALTIGIENGPDLELRWVFSTQSGEGIELIKHAMKKYDRINLKAAPYGYKDGEQAAQLERIVKYYKFLGFKETADYKDIKYGGTIPMVWQYNKLMGTR